MSALISADGRYRYRLSRGLSNARSRPCLFVMLNPSTADATMDDPTIRRCVRFAEREHCDSLTVVNLFALRATDPKELIRDANPIGKLNESIVRCAIESHITFDGLIIAAWGGNVPRSYASQLAPVIDLIRNNWAMCFGHTKEGHPRHPLYLPSNAPLVPFKRG